MNCGVRQEGKIPGDWGVEAWGGGRGGEEKGFDEYIGGGDMKWKLGAMMKCKTETELGVGEGRRYGGSYSRSRGSINRVVD